MDRVHDVQDVSFKGTWMLLKIDGKNYRIDLAERSIRLARATQQQRENVEITPSGYGLHWPDIDEDLSIDGLIGVKHAPSRISIER
jgi:hypothetical protein